MLVLLVERGSIPPEADGATHCELWRGNTLTVAYNETCLDKNPLGNTRTTTIASQFSFKSATSLRNPLYPTMQKCPLNCKN
jgi:hypothetical protein